MPNNSDIGTKMRVLQLLCLLVERPKKYTIKDLANKYGCDEKTISNDLLAFKNIGLEYSYDNRYRYFLEQNKTLDQLKGLLFFTEDDRALLIEAVHQLGYNSEKQKSLSRKLENLYDFRQLGLNNLRENNLKKIDLLTEAKSERKKARLIDYRSSNSNSIRTRFVEPFHVDAEHDTVQTYDLEEKQLRHFRMSRILRVEVCEEEWTCENHHNIRPTDPFRIVDSEQIRVHIKMKISAYNELTERFPQTKRYIEPSAEAEGVYDFECSVNHKFLGLSNFILGFHYDIIEVVSPEGLRNHLNELVRRINF